MRYSCNQIQIFRPNGSRSSPSVIIQSCGSRRMNRKLCYRNTQAPSNNIPYQIRSSTSFLAGYLVKNPSQQNFHFFRFVFWVIRRVNIRQTSAYPLGRIPCRFIRWPLTGSCGPSCVFECFTCFISHFISELKITFPKTLGVLARIRNIIPKRFILKSLGKDIEIHPVHRAFLQDCIKHLINLITSNPDC